MAEPHKPFTASKYWIPLTLLSGFFSLTFTRQLRMQYSCLKVLKNKSKAAELQKWFGFFFFPRSEQWERVMGQETPRALPHTFRTSWKMRRIWGKTGIFLVSTALCATDIKNLALLSLVLCWIHAPPQCNQRMETHRRGQPRVFGSPMTFQMFREEEMSRKEDTNREVPARRTSLVLNNGLWDPVK